MLIIRKEQIDELSKVAVKRFEDWMVVHLNKFFPDHCKALGEDGVRETIQYGIKRGAIYELVSERDVCKYTDLMFAFGRDFDQDTELQWTSEILNDESLQGQPTKKINLLYKVAKKNVAKAGGINPEVED
ncbi:MAG: hypothetical protein GY799_30515 [Desulfobulbaceae bacterium]|nr:hypothetical protein [Desulfobulbaceae bacterium]